MSLIRLYSDRLRYFYDIECYDNLFMIGFLDANDVYECHFLAEDPELIYEAGRQYMDKYPDRLVVLYNLADDMSVLKKRFAFTIPRLKKSITAKFLNKDDRQTESENDQYIGYNIYHYDLPLIQFVLKNEMSGRLNVSTKKLREISDKIIANTFRSNVEDFMKWGGQVDIARINQKQMQNGRVIMGLKTAEGILGGSIVESESNKTGHSKDPISDFFYLGNDLYATRDIAFPGFLKDNLEIREALFKEFPYLKDTPVHLSSTSTDIGVHVVKPHGQLEDIPVVDFMYPADHIAKEFNIEQQDILEYTKNWYIKNVYYRIKNKNPKYARYHLGKFMSLYNFYKSFAGRNWNDNPDHIAKYGIPCEERKARRDRLKEYGTYLAFVDGEGDETRSWINASSGGIHGQDYNDEQLTFDRKVIKILKEKYGKFSKIPADVVKLLNQYDKELFTMIKEQSREKTSFPDRMNHEVPQLAKITEFSDEIIDPEDFSPFYTKTTGPEDERIEGADKRYLKSRYRYTSVGEAVHQDFTGYYPVLLIMTGAFYDGKGRDVYREVYNKRVEIKKTLKTLEYLSPEWITANNKQEGYKLILNAVSGALDGTLMTNIKANNKGIKMRIIGQLLTYIMSQALVLEGATMPSSNTDGVYAFDMDIDVNKKIVAKELKPFHVDIEPEPLFFISKDTNNRVELVDGKVVSAKGGMLTSSNGPSITHNLAHPAIVEAALVKYLQNPNIVNHELNPDLGRKAFVDYVKETDKDKLIHMLSWTMRSTNGSFLIDDQNVIHKGTNRAFLTKNGVKLTRVAVKKVDCGQKLFDQANQLNGTDPLGDPKIIALLKEQGELGLVENDAISVNEYGSHLVEYKDAEKIPTVPAAQPTKINGLPDDARVTFFNESLMSMTEDQKDELLANIDWTAYHQMLMDFAVKWHNVTKRDAYDQLMSLA